MNEKVYLVNEENNQNFENALRDARVEFTRFDSEKEYVYNRFVDNIELQSAALQTITNENLREAYTNRVIDSIDPNYLQSQQEFQPGVDIENNLFNTLNEALVNVENSVTNEAGSNVFTSIALQALANVNDIQIINVEYKEE